MQKREALIYKASTGLFSLFMLFGAAMYFFQYDMVAEMFTSIGHPTHIIYPLALAKIAGVITLWLPAARRFREWAYAGFVYVFILAIMAHLSANDGGFMGATVALLLVLTSYHYSKK